MNWTLSKAYTADTPDTYKHDWPLETTSAKPYTYISLVYFSLFPEYMYTYGEHVLPNNTE